MKLNNKKQSNYKTITIKKVDKITKAYNLKGVVRDPNIVLILKELVILEDL